MRTLEIDSTHQTQTLPQKTHPNPLCSANEEINLHTFAWWSIQISGWKNPHSLKVLHKFSKYSLILYFYLRRFFKSFKTRAEEYNNYLCLHTTTLWGEVSNNTHPIMEGNFLIPGTLERALRSFVNPATWSLFGTFQISKRKEKKNNQNLNVISVHIVCILQNFKTLKTKKPPQKIVV